MNSTRTRTTLAAAVAGVVVAATAGWLSAPGPEPTPAPGPAPEIRGVSPDPVPKHRLLLWVTWKATPVRVSMQLGPSVVPVGQPGARPWTQLVPDNGQYTAVGVDVEADGFAQCAIFRPPMELVDEAHTSSAGFIGCEANSPRTGTG